MLKSAGRNRRRGCYCSEEAADLELNLCLEARPIILSSLVRKDPGHVPGWGRMWGGWTISPGSLSLTNWTDTFLRAGQDSKRIGFSFLS